MKKLLIIQDTFISGDPVFAGDVVEADSSNTSNLFLAKRAVELSKATDEQKKLIAARQAAIAAAEKAAAAKGAK